MILSKEEIQFNDVKYDILLANNFDNLPEEISKLDSFSKLIIISEKKVAKLYSKELRKVLLDKNLKTDIILIQGGEKNKHIKRVQKVYNKLIKLGADRKSIILALGGGVIGDFSGFIASTFLRGIRFIQIPTTLLACVDSSVGGKVAVNVDFGKNMVGSFHQPKLVYAALHTLETLEDKEWKCGIAEVIKHSLLKGGSFFESMNTIRFEDIKSISTQSFMILESVKFKKEIVSQDEKETGLRGILNLGHTLGHAIESLTNYKKYSHGEAVAQGLIFAVILSIYKKSLSPIYFEKIINIMKNFKIKTIDKKLSIHKLIKHMYHDKKTTDGNLKFILLDEIGNASFGNEISEEEILNSYYEYSKLS